MSPRICFIQGFAALVLVLFLAESGFSPVAAQSWPDCASELSDPDGDGYGWENGQTCLVRVKATEVIQCRSAASDVDGDGYGWENGKSCRVAATESSAFCNSALSDSDGDGYGWENGQTCLVKSETRQSAAEEPYVLRHPACSHSRYDTDSDGYGWENSTTCTLKNFGDGGAGITDVVLITGQSNALGAETVQFDNDRYNIQLDTPVKRAYVYASTGWTIAGLRQIWDRGWYPRSDIASDPANNFALHFAKHVVLDDPQRVVGFILITAPGEAIAHWDKGGDFYADIKRKVEGALSQLPHKSRVDAVLWHQGESDYYDSQYYGDKLNALISNLRSETWVADTAIFICGETLNAPVNARLMTLNWDSDPDTGCVDSDGLASIGDGIHFSADSLRELGARYARKYLEISAR